MIQFEEEEGVGAGTRRTLRKESVVGVYNDGRGRCIINVCMQQRTQRYQLTVRPTLHPLPCPISITSTRTSFANRAHLLT
jgi:hypothetical protein